MSYTATSYVFIQGGWQNRLAALCVEWMSTPDDRKTRGDFKVVPGSASSLADRSANPTNWFASMTASLR